MNYLTDADFHQAREDVARGLEHEYSHYLGRVRTARGLLKLASTPDDLPDWWADWVRVFQAPAGAQYWMESLEVVDSTIEAVRAAESPREIYAALSQLTELADRLKQGQEAS